MTSTRTQLPVEYYYLPFCQPENGPIMNNQNLGQLLQGDRIMSSPYLIRMKVEMYCEQVCSANLGRPFVPGTRTHPNPVVKAIDKGYRNNWIVDNLPAASKVENDDFITTRFWQGFPIGFVSADDGKAYIHNHVNIEIMYHENEAQKGTYRVVRFMVEPFSIKHEYVDATEEDHMHYDNVMPMDFKITNPIASCQATPVSHTTYDMVTAANHEPQEASGQVLFTYDVIWTENKDLKWASRWDIYLSMNNAAPPKAHWNAIGNALFWAMALSALLVIILRRSIHYQRLSTNEEESSDARERFLFEPVQADIFRPPSMPMWFAVACGTGAQLLATAALTIMVLCMGFWSPAQRGRLVQGALVIFFSMGFVNGYVAARLYKAFNGKNLYEAWKRASFSFSFVAFVVFMVCNCGFSLAYSTYVVPSATLFVLAVLFTFSCLLVRLGASVGYKQEVVQFRDKASSSPRKIPRQPWFLSMPCTTFFSGLLPFGSCFVELYYIMTSLWLETYYFTFGFVLLVFLILIVMTAEISIMLTYFQLRREDHRWMWRAFVNGGALGFYVFFYSIFTFLPRLELSVKLAFILYVGYMFVVSLAVFVMYGFVGAMASLWFTRAVFASIKDGNDDQDLPKVLTLA